MHIFILLALYAVVFLHLYPTIVLAKCWTRYSCITFLFFKQIKVGMVIGISVLCYTFAYCIFMRNTGRSAWLWNCLFFYISCNAIQSLKPVSCTSNWQFKKIKMLGLEIAKNQQQKNKTLSGMLLLDANKSEEIRVKEVSNSRVLKHVKAQHLQLSHINWLQIKIMCDNFKWL